jgi:hypothetical protein
MDKNVAECKVLALGEIGQFLGYDHEKFDCISIHKKNINIRYKHGQLFSLSLFFKLRKKIKNGYYDLILAGSNPYPIYLHDRSLFKNVRNFLDILFFNFPAIGLSLLPWLLRGTDIPLAGVNSDDRPRIPKEDFYLLKRGDCYFMREMPQDKTLLFLNADKRSKALENIRGNAFYQKAFKKMYPISLGIADRIAKHKLAPSKDIDVFFCGDINSTVREEGAKNLQKLSQEGYKVQFLTSRIPFDEFYDYCSRSWLVWSPNGRGWDCYRHYEACMAGSVPVINYPTIIRYQPLMDRKHCFYYGNEGDHLYHMIKDALNNKNKLKQMGEAARNHCLQFHTSSEILRYIIETTLTQSKPGTKGRC